jgi:hypothetical protein
MGIFNNDKLAVGPNDTPGTKHQNIADIAHGIGTVGGAKRGPKGPRVKGSDPAKNKNAEGAAIIKKLLTPKICGEAGVLPCDLMATLTGYDGFKATEKEKEEIAEPTLQVLVQFELIKDPKWVALGVYLYYITRMMSTKGIQWNLEKQKRSGRSQTPKNSEKSSASSENKGSEKVTS